MFSGITIRFRLRIAGGDADATLRVAEVQKQVLLQDPALTRFYIHIMHPAARAFEKVEQHGVLVDRQAYAEVEADLNREILQLTAQAKQILGGRVVAKHFDPDKPGGINLTKPTLLTDFFFGPMGLGLKPKMVTEKTKAASTALEHLMMFKDVPEASAFVNLLGDYRQARKSRVQLIAGFFQGANAAWVAMAAKPTLI